MTTSWYFGIDVSKSRLDVGSTDGHLFSVDNTEEGIHELMDRIRDLASDALIRRICVESTGSYSLLLVDMLHQQGLPVSLVAPNCVRHFTRSLGVHAKTDAIDCRMIALYAEALKPKLYRPAGTKERQLRALVDRREQVVNDRVREQCRLESCPDKGICTRIRRHIRSLKNEEAKLDKDIRALLRDEDMRQKAEVLTNVTSVSDTTASVLISYLPELGQVNRQHISALAGIAPYNNSSGSRDGKRSIYGGRRRITRALYMATLSAIRHNVFISGFYQKLLKRGKPKKVALIACARKLLVYLNGLVAGCLERDHAAAAS